MNNFHGIQVTKIDDNESQSLVPKILKGSSKIITGKKDDPKHVQLFYNLHHPFLIFDFIKEFPKYVAEKWQVICWRSMGEA